MLSKRPNGTFKVDGPYELKWQHVNMRTSKLIKVETGIHDLAKNKKKERKEAIK